MKPIFQKNLQFRDIWPRNRQKNLKIEVFGHFLDFASLVFLNFAHNDRWAWCLVVSYNLPVQLMHSCYIYEIDFNLDSMGVLHNKYVINYFQDRHFERPLWPGQMCLCWIFFIMLNETPSPSKMNPWQSGLSLI